MRKQFQPSAALEADPYDRQAHYSKALILSVQAFHTHDLGVLNTALQNLNKALQFNSERIVDADLGLGIRVHIPGEVLPTN